MLPTLAAFLSMDALKPGLETPISSWDHNRDGQISIDRIKRVRGRIIAYFFSRKGLSAVLSPVRPSRVPPGQPLLF
jgi:hypothetical protein